MASTCTEQRAINPSSNRPPSPEEMQVDSSDSCNGKDDMFSLPLRYDFSNYPISGRRITYSRSKRPSPPTIFIPQPGVFPRIPPFPGVNAVITAPSNHIFVQSVQPSPLSSPRPPLPLPPAAPAPMLTLPLPPAAPAPILTQPPPPALPPQPILPSLQISDQKMFVSSSVYQQNLDPYQLVYQPISESSGYRLMIAMPVGHREDGTYGVLTSRVQSEQISRYSTYYVNSVTYYSVP